MLKFTFVCLKNWVGKMKRSILIIFCLLVISEILAAKDITKKFEFEGDSREYIIHLPVGYNLKKDWLFLPIEFDIDEKSEVFLIDNQCNKLGDGIIEKILIPATV